MRATPLVLYAEDDENDAFFMERAFAKLKSPATLRIMPNGRAVIEYLSGEGGFSDRKKYPLPALIILDIKMPLMSGLEVLEALRSEPALRALPVIMFTSSTQDSDIA